MTDLRHCHDSAGCRRRAFTLVEALVVIGIVGILMGLLIPAIVQARSAARQAGCASNLKQLAHGVQQFHELQGMLPVYWGAMRSSSGSTKFAGWLLHILPHLEQTPLYDALPDSGLVPRYVSRPTGKILPAVPASDDYTPGTWVTSTIGWITRTNIKIPLLRVELVGRVGTPGVPARPEYRWVQDGMQLAGLPSSFGAAQARAALPVLQCTDDASSIGTFADLPSDSNKWVTTNYMANSHVFCKFGNGQRIMSGGFAGLFNPTRAANEHGVAWGNFSHAISGSSSTVSRQFGHVVDGLTNTILFGEAMRQCDGGRSFRLAFLPSGMQTHEHSFGIEVSINAGTGSVWPGSQGNATYGNTLMFQSRPGVADCNPFRVQSNHDSVYMVAMCDGSVRAISNAVTRREAVGPEACGRAGFGTMLYSPESRGMGAQDGIWDMLLVPADPPGNVLPNTGEIGHER